MSVIRFGFNGGGHRSQRMRAGRGLPPRERRRMRIMAVYTLFALGGAQVVIPITADSPVRAGFPVPIRRAVATAAQSRAVCEFHRMAVTGLQQLQVGFVVAVEAVIVATMSAMPHDDVRMFLGNNQVLVRVISQRRRLPFFMADRTVKIGQVLARAHKVCVRTPHRRGVQEIGVHQRNRRQAHGPSRPIREKQRCQRQESQDQPGQSQPCSGLRVH